MGTTPQKEATKRQKTPSHSMRKMISWNLCVLLCYLITAVTAEPSCEGVPDFGGCQGDLAGFCPKGVECSCKSGHAFCSCPYYKGPNADYWYLGEKCDRLWSTWDLVTVTVFPGVALAFVVGVTAQLIHYCKTAPKSKPKKEKKAESQRQSGQTHQNRAFMPEEPSRSSRYNDVPLTNVSAQAPKKNPAAAWNVPAPQPQNRMSAYYEAPAENRLRGYEEPRPQKLQRSGWGYPEQDYNSRELQTPQRASYGGPNPRGAQSYGRGFPEQDYDSSDLQNPQQLPRSGAPPLPQADYGWGNQESEGPAAGWGGRSYSFGRPQLRNNYDY